MGVPEPEELIGLFAWVVVVIVLALAGIFAAGMVVGWLL